MQVEEVAVSEYGAPGGWKLTGWSSVDDLLAFRDERRAEAPENQVLYIVDHEPQARYTSMHASDMNRFYQPDQSQMSAEEIHAYEHESVLTPERHAETYVANLRAMAAQSDLTAATARLLSIDADEVRLVEAYSEPERVFEQPLYCLSIRGDGPSDAIAAQPNCYFSGDLNPGENYLLAEQLHQQFGYEILGLGSYLAAYVRPEPFDLAQVTEVIGSVRHLYPDLDDAGVAAWAEAAADRRWFLLHVRGS